MTTTAQNVVLIPPSALASALGIGAARPVTGPAWNDFGRLTNWIIGRGRQLVSGASALIGIGTFDFQFVVSADGHHSTQVWCFTLCALAGHDVIIKGEITVGAKTVSFSVGALPQTYYVIVDATVDTPANPSTESAGNEISCSITTHSPSTDDILEASVSVWEAPKRYVNTGVIDGTLATSAPIYDGTIGCKSIGAMQLAQTFARQVTRRAALLNYVNPRCSSVSPSDPGGLSITSTSYVDLNPLKAALQTRIMRAGETTRRIDVHVRAAGAGNSRFTMTNGAVLTITHTSPTPAWESATLLVSTDDPDTYDSGGIRGGTRDEVRIELKKNSGTDIRIYSICITDPPGI